LRPAVFLDRDGVLNRALVRDGQAYAPRTVAEFELYPDATAACRELHAAGFILVVATNQPDVARGTLALTDLEAMHARLRAAIPEIARIEVCLAPGQGQPHPEDRRRKPAPGMLLDAAAALGLDLARSWMVGDRWRDIDCGHNAAVRTVFIDLGYAEKLHAAPDFTAPGLAAAVRIILAQPESQKLNPSSQSR
jgi:D-glycero-D-manno-heptose 1,7-bisphosphate phosphatase